MTTEAQLVSKLRECKRKGNQIKKGRNQLKKEKTLKVEYSNYAKAQKYNEGEKAEGQRKREGRTAINLKKNSMR